ncbi:fumarylacetoacetate hydrolase family protein [Polaromonas sp.]|uniref:fumarylacetoacetate hydrolase family protein n=1 Tax=Polaromonas sp. TaxID=1869339 RepID=UPI003BAA4446
MLWYALATYETNAGLKRPAWVFDSELYDVEASLAAIDGTPDALRASVGETIAQWQALCPETAACAARVAQAIAKQSLKPLAQGSYRLCAPYQPARVFATASNYHEHAKEMGTQLAARAESSPYIFIKAETSITDPGAKVVKPREVERLDWEVELGVVIGTGGRHISVEQALEHVAGYVVFNDVTSRDLTRRSDYPFSHDWFRGKSFDTFGPMGPWFVPRDCLGDPQTLRLTLDVNGERMQDGSAGEMIFSVAEQIAYLSRIMTLKPGDLIATGTPTGVGMGRGIFLKAGDVMRAGIEGIGTIENQVVAE